MTTDPQTPVSPSNRRALVHNAITDALSKAGDWVPLSVRIAATRAALAEVDAWHADEPAPAGLGVSATPSHTDLRQRIAEAVRRQAETGNVRYEALADAVLAELPPPADPAAGWLDAAAECNKAGGAYAERGAHDAAGAAFALMEKFLMEAGKAKYLATPCSAPDYCEDGGEPCSVHERLMGHAEGDHELCAPDCGEPWMRRLADEAQQPEPPVHGESVAHLAGLHGRRDQWADDEQAGFVPPAAEGLPAGTLEAAEIGANRLDAWARTPQGRNFLAHALIQLARTGWLRTEPADGFEPVRERDDIPEPQDPATLADRLRCPQCGEDITDYSEDDHVYRTGDERAYCSGECVVAAHRADVARQDGEA